MADKARGERNRRPMEMSGLLVPADPTLPVQIVNLWQDGKDGELRRLQAAVGGLVDVRATPLGDIWMNDEGRMNGSGLNARVTSWTLNDSPEAKAGQLRGVEEYWKVFGDVVLTGPADREGDITPVGKEAVEVFGGMDIHPDAMRDWNEPVLPPVIITDWDFGEGDTGIDM